MFPEQGSKFQRLLTTFVCFMSDSVRRQGSVSTRKRERFKTIRCFFAAARDLRRPHGHANAPISCAKEALGACTTRTKK